MVQAILFLPLLGALIAGLFGTKAFKQMGRDAEVYGDHGTHGHDDSHDHAHDDHHGH
jgi:NADH-quinone oxidoreductase subunit L